MNIMSDDGIKKVGRYLKYAMIALVVVLLVLAIFITRDYLSLHRKQLIDAQKLQLSALLNNHHPLTASDVTIVSPWMTFAYINRLFNIPPSYLETSLSISDSSYPQLSLSGYAKHERINVALLVNEVEGSLYNYFTAATSTN